MPMTVDDLANAIRGIDGWREKGAANIAEGLMPFIERHIAAPSQPAAGSADADRDAGGRIVREAWVRWAQQQPNPKPSWLAPYDELSEPDKEADRQIFEAVARRLTASAAVNQQLTTDASAQQPAERERVELPEGWAMVPREASGKMISEARKRGRGLEECWQIMVDLAPPPPAAQPNCSQSPKSWGASDYVLVPRNLTAENGAKAEFMGESYGGVQIPWTAIKQLHWAIVKWAEGQQPIAHGDSEREDAERWRMDACRLFEQKPAKGEGE